MVAVEAGLRELGLAQPLDQQSVRGQKLGVRLERPVPAHEAHGQAFALERLVRDRLVEVRAVDHERTVGGALRERPSRIERMNDREVQPPARDEDAGRLAQRAWEIVHVLKRHERDDQPEGRNGER